MTRNEFESEFYKPGNSLLRLGHLMLALRSGPSWNDWSLQVNDNTPSYYNEIIFLQCATFFLLKPTRRKLLHMLGFFQLRNNREKGFVVDPIHRQSDARLAIRELVNLVSVDFAATHELDEVRNLKVHKAPNLIDTMTLNYTGERKAEIFRFRMKSVISEMWLPGGALKLYLSNVVGNRSHDEIQRTFRSNMNTALADESKSNWYQSWIAKMEGRSMSAQLGTPFDPTQMGLKALLVGGHRR